MIRPILKNLFAMSVLMAMLCSLSGCVGSMLGRNSDSETQLVIPDFPTAKEQFAFAKMFQSGQITSPELDKRRVQMDKLAQYYNRVLVNFPNDTNYVPLTYLELGDAAAQSDYLDKAVQAYQHAMSITQDEFVQVRSQYSIAHIYDIQGRHVDAKQIYKRLIDNHKNTQSGRVRDVLKRAHQRYMTVQEKPAAGAQTGR